MIKMNGPRKLEYEFALDNLQAGSILDVGISRKQMIAELSNRIEDITIIDIQDKRKGYPNIKTIIGDIVTIKPEKIGKFSNILCISTLEHIAISDNNSIEDSFDIQFKAIKNMVSLLEDNGVLIITVPYGKTINNPKTAVFYTNKRIKDIEKNFNVTCKKIITPTDKVNLNKTEWKEVEDIRKLTRSQKDLNHTDLESGSPVGIIMIKINK